MPIIFAWPLFIINEETGFQKERGAFVLTNFLNLNLTLKIKFGFKQKKAGEHTIAPRPFSF